MAVKAKGKAVSIVINNEFVKICEVTKNGKNVVIHKAVTVVTPEHCFADGAIKDREELAKTIKVALDDNRIMTDKVIFSVASTRIATKEVIIPNVKSNKIASIIMANATEYFPVNIEEYIVQYSVLEHIEDQGIEKIKVMVMAAPAEMIEAYYDLASSLGQKIEAVDYVGNSTYQEIRQQIDNSVCLVAHVENDATIVNIFKNNVLQFQRTIPYGKSVLVNAIMESRKVSYEQALNLLQEERVLHEHFDGDAVTESLRYLVSNINRIVDYYVSRNSHVMIEKSYVIGNATTITGFVELLANELNFPLTSITQLKDVSVDKKTYVDESTVTGYISNIGVMLAPVNFVPVFRADEVKKKDNAGFFKVILGTSVIAALIMVIVPLATMLSAKNDRDTMQGNVDRIKDIEIVVNDYYKAKDMATDAQKFQSLTINNDDSLQNFITELEQKTPSDIAVKSMTVNAGNVTVNGTASGKSSLGKLIEQLQSINSISSVNISNETEAKDNTGSITITFSLTCSFSSAVSGK